MMTHANTINTTDEHPPIDPHQKMDEERVPYQAGAPGASLNVPPPDSGAPPPASFKLKIKPPAE